MEPRNEREAHGAIVEACPPCTAEERDEPDYRGLRLVLLGLVAFRSIVIAAVRSCG